MADGTNESTGATNTETTASATGVTMPEQILGGETKTEATGKSAAVEDGATGEAKTQEGATGEKKPAQGEPKYDKDGFELDAEGKQKLDAEGKPIKKPDTEKPAAKAPAEYAEFTLPEGATLDEQSATEFKGLAKELDLTQEQAQKLLDFGGGKIRAQVEAPYKLWAETQTKWQAEVKADPEIGGTKYESSIAAASQVFVPGESNPFVKDAKEATALKEALNMTGAGNNPAIVKMFVKMGNLLKEPGSLTGNPVKDTGAKLLENMYPTMKSEQ
jgi:hypothetical protein